MNPMPNFRSSLPQLGSTKFPHTWEVLNPLSLSKIIPLICWLSVKPSQCNSTSRKNTPMQQNCPKYLTNDGSLISFEIQKALQLCNTVYLMTGSTLLNCFGLAPSLSQGRKRVTHRPNVDHPLAFLKSAKYRKVIQDFHLLFEGGGEGLFFSSSLFIFLRFGQRILLWR